MRVAVSSRPVKDCPARRTVRFEVRGQALAVPPPPSPEGEGAEDDHANGLSVPCSWVLAATDAGGFR